jgi:hypothetical protein
MTDRRPSVGTFSTRSGLALLRVKSGTHRGAEVKIGGGPIKIGNEIRSDLVFRDSNIDFSIEIEHADQKLRVKNLSGCEFTVNRVGVGTNEDAEVDLSVNVANLEHNGIQIDILALGADQNAPSQSIKAGLKNNLLGKIPSVPSTSKSFVYKLAAGLVFVNVLGFIYRPINFSGNVTGAMTQTTLVPVKAVDMQDKFKLTSKKLSEMFSEHQLFLKPVSSTVVRLYGVYSSDARLAAIQSFLADELPDFKVEIEAVLRQNGPATKPQTAWLNTVSVIEPPTGKTYIRTREGEVFVVGALTPDQWSIVRISPTHIDLKKEKDEFTIEIKRN